jgi:DNA-binding transcriptional regulator YdaS (Cro superfamily)
MEEQETALAAAIEKAGGPAALARYITEHYEPITAQAVCDWRRCPPKRVLQVEAACGAAVTRHALRPDLYPPEQPRLSVAL